MSTPVNLKIDSSQAVIADFIQGWMTRLGIAEDVRWLHQGMRCVQWPGVCAYKKIGG